MTNVLRFPARQGDALLGALIAVATLGYLLAFPPTLNTADESFTLYGAKRVLAGDALYRDTFDFITPLSFHYYALFFGLGGTTIGVARFAMALGNALSAVLTYSLARKVAAPFEAALAALLFTVGCVPVWNMASQHWLSTTLCLAAAATLLSERWQDSPGLRAVMAGVLVGLCICNQQQRGAALLVWLILATPLLARWTSTPNHPRQPLRELVLALAGAGAVTVAILGYAIWRSSLTEFLDATVRFVFTGYSSLNLGKVHWGGTSILAAWRLPLAFGWLPSGLPVILGLEAVILSTVVLRRRSHPEAVRTTLLGLAALMAASVLYYPDFIHVAFIAPFAFIVAAGVVHRMRVALALRSRLLGAVCIVGLAAVAAGGIAKGARTLREQRAAFPERFPTAFGTLAGPPWIRVAFEELAAAVRDVPAEHRSLYAHPGDAWLYLSLPASNPLPYLLVFPNYTRPTQYDRILDAIARRVPQLVVVNHLMARPDDPVVQAVERHYGEGTKLFPAYTLHRRPTGDGPPP